MKLALINQVIGFPITYTKGGSRNGWQGVIVSVDESNQKVNILFDNGVDQQYHPSALEIPKHMLAPGESNEYNGDNRYGSNIGSAYLKIGKERRNTHVIKPQSNHQAQPLPQSSFIIVNMSTGQVVGIETDADQADEFAAEQASDSIEKHTFTVFSPKSSFAVKRPLASRITNFLGLKK